MLQNWEPRPAEALLTPLRAFFYGMYMNVP